MVGGRCAGGLAAASAAAAAASAAGLPAHLPLLHPAPPVPPLRAEESLATRLARREVGVASAAARLDPENWRREVQVAAALRRTADVLALVASDAGRPTAA